MATPGKKTPAILWQCRSLWTCVTFNLAEMNVVALSTNENLYFYVIFRLIVHIFVKKNNEYRKSDDGWPVICKLQPLQICRLLIFLLSFHVFFASLCPKFERENHIICLCFIHSNNVNSLLYNQRECRRQKRGGRKSRKNIKQQKINKKTERNSPAGTF